jgi:hypothetical protein
VPTWVFDKHFGKAGIAIHLISDPAYIPVLGVTRRTEAVISDECDIIVTTLAYPDCIRKFSKCRVNVN